MREYQSFDQELTLDTEFGKVRVIANGPDTLYLDANSNGAHLLIRGVAYATTAHLVKRGDSWELRNDSSLYMSRSIYSNKYNQPVSDTAKRKALEVFTRVASEYVKAKPEALRIAGEQSRNNELSRIADDIGETIEKLGESMKRLREVGALEKVAELRKVQLDLHNIKDNL